MMPRNALGRSSYKKLKVYTGTEHPHSAQNPKTYELSA
jgi:large subunit ribosomal protein L13